MIEHVRRRAMLCESIENVYVATGDKEIASTVGKYGGSVIMTSDTHKNGTTRVAEAISEIDCSHVLLLQGDEPLILPRHLEILLKDIEQDSSFNAWNATGPIEQIEELDRHSFVKCMVTEDNRILSCFRRSPSHSPLKAQQKFIRKILGIIAYRKDFLLQLCQLPPTPIESSELIEQMRIIENGFRLKSVPMPESLPSVNEPHEAEIVLEKIKNDVEQTELLQQIST